ncbi:DUF5675 family protein [Flavobacterium sp.]|uniref:DUF5675 family protein n=1 Tax=Flavobacterium sp. TaxID=239 RepID=UPI002CE03A57|nr:DUF5675 family protein [Flavobacterium sp.]HQA74133.1 DUF5675 family protein [Flavobacterium sp.]
MVLKLKRNYTREGVTGTLTIDKAYICYTLELPWRDNQVKVSCIPEGSYRLRKRYSQKYRWHLEVCDVPNRSFILLHPANDAQKELQGCIAPVSILTGRGSGLYSRIALQKVCALVYAALDRNESVYLLII